MTVGVCEREFSVLHKPPPVGICPVVNVVDQCTRRTERHLSHRDVLTVHAGLSVGRSHGAFVGGVALTVDFFEKRTTVRGKVGALAAAHRKRLVQKSVGWQRCAHFVDRVVDLSGAVVGVGAFGRHVRCKHRPKVSVVRRIVEHHSVKILLRHFSTCGLRAVYLASRLFSCQFPFQVSTTTVLFFIWICDSCDGLHTIKVAFVFFKIKFTVRTFVVA